jgi:spermidine synthase
VLPLLFLFAASGGAALIYEMAWFHQVQLVVGGSSLSVAVILCSFMGGIAAGSWLAPKVTPAGAHPLRAIAIIEAAIAAFGLLIPLSLPVMQQAYVAMVGHGFGAVLLRAAVCVLVLTPPTMLMGATLPIIATWRAADIGRIYTANLAGAAIGTALTGFFLLPVFDVFVATGVAVSLNLVVAAICWSLSRTAPRAPVAPSAPVTPAAPVAPAFTAAFLSGFTSLGAEVVWTRQLSLLFGASVYTFCLILTVFLGGLAIGGGIGALLVRRSARPAVVLGGVQTGLALAISVGAWLIVNALPQWQPTRQFLPGIHASPALTFAFDAARCAVAMLPATILWGASFPLTIAAAGGSPRSVSRINALNTAGALAGAIGLTLVGIPLLGSQVSQQALALCAALSGIAVLANVIPIGRAAAAAAAAAVVAIAIVPAVPGRLIAYGRSVNSWESIKRFLYLAEGATASVAVTEGVAGAKQFHIAGKVEASDMDIDMRLERMLGHVPALVHPRPRSVLIVGVGAGVTAGALSIHPEIERIVVCEIERVVPESARRYFGEENHHVFDDRRVELVFDDARHFLQTTAEKFDIITSDPIHPWVRGAATLYSLEYLQLVRAHLNPGGIVTQWIPLYETDERSVKSEIGTFASVFPDTTLWNPDLLEEGYDLVGLGRVDGATISQSLLQARLDASPAVKASLKAVALTSAADLLSTYAGRASDLAPWLADAQINRERHLRLQYLAGLAANTDQRYLIFQSMLKYRKYPTDLFEASAGLEATFREWYLNAPPEARPAKTSAPPEAGPDDSAGIEAKPRSP